MSFLYAARPYKEEDKQKAVAKLLENALPDRDFYLLIVSAIVLAACGILIDSLPVLIASMIVAPLAYPILSLGLGIVAGNRKLLFRSLSMLVIAIVLAIFVGGIFSLVVRNYFSVAERVFISFFPNIFFDVLIAIVSGVVAVYGLVRSRVGAVMTGIGIAVSLMPPLVAIGIGLFDPVGDLAVRGGSIFLLNVFGILVGSMITFWALGIHRHV